MLADDLPNRFNNPDLFRGPSGSVHQSRTLLTSSFERLMNSFCVPGRVVHAALARIDLDNVSCVLHNEYSMDTLTMIASKTVHLIDDSFAEVLVCVLPHRVQFVGDV